MENIGSTLKQRFEQIIVENEMLRAGFAAMPYLVLKDTGLSPGARLAYALLLMYAWQEGSCFPGQERMARDMGISERHLRRFLNELKDASYIAWERTQTTNLYRILEVRSKLKKRKMRPLGRGCPGG